MFQVDKFKAGHSRIIKAQAEPESSLTIVVYLRPKCTGIENNYVAFMSQHPSKRKYSDLDSALSECSKEAADLLVEFCNENNLSADLSELLSGKISVNGKLKDFASALKVIFYIYDYDGHEHLGYEGELAFPENLYEHVLSISGLDKGLIKGTRTKLSSMESVAEYGGTSLKTFHANSFQGYSPKQIEKSYNFPEGDCIGECIGLVELGGTYKASDIEEYCKNHSITIPEIVTVGTQPPVSTNASSKMIYDLEVTMDLEIVSGLAKGAKIVIYYASNIPDAIHLALNDNSNNPSVISVSWAWAEGDCSLAERNAMEVLALQAMQKGVTVVCASGDHGAFNNKNYLNVMWPASQPFILGCGGTSLHSVGGSENVWYTSPTLASGGGYSSVYQIPQYQNNAIRGYYLFFPHGGMSRGIPDVSANAAVSTAYNIFFSGESKAQGAGTSASTPVWASLILKLNKKLGYRLGFLNELLYMLNGSGAFKQIYQGNNGYYPAAPGWNPATGLGAPNGSELLSAMQESEKYYKENEND